MRRTPVAVGAAREPRSNQPLGVDASGLGVVDDEQLAVTALDRELGEQQGQLADLRMVQPDGLALHRLDVVAGPRPPELLAAERELPHELHDPRVVDVGADPSSEAGDQPGHQPLPVRVQGTLGGVEEDRAHPVLAHPDVGRQRGGQGVRGEHVEVATLHERGQPDHLEQLGDRHRDDLTPGVASARRRARGTQADQVVGGGRLQLEHPRQRLQDLGRRVAVATLLEPQVVVGADAGEHRHLLAPEARHPAYPMDRDADRLGRDQLTARPQVVAQPVVLVHPSTVIRRRQPSLSLPLPGSPGVWVSTTRHVIVEP